MHRLILLLLLFVCGILQPLQAQELRATVELRSEALGSDGQVHQQALQRQLTDLLSRTRWTDLAYKEGERIEAHFLFTLHERSEAGEYRGELIISAHRPVYGTDYKSPTLLLRDPHITFTYLPGESLTLPRDRTRASPRRALSLLLRPIRHRQRPRQLLPPSEEVDCRLD